MKVNALICPNCNGSLEYEDGIDDLYCKHCGYRIILQGRSKESYKAKMHSMQLNHEERLKDKEYAHERYKIQQEKDDERKTVSRIFMIFGAVFVFLLFLFIGVSSAENKLERKLQKTVDEILICIENENFDEAYIKANSLYWDEDLSKSGVKKWNAIRKEVLNQIKEAEKEAAKNSKKSSSKNDSISAAIWADKFLKNHIFK